MVVEVLVPQFGRAGIAEKNVGEKAAAAVTVATCGAIMCGLAKMLV